MKRAAISLICLAVSAQLLVAPQALRAESEESDEIADYSDSHSVLHTVVWYIPDRILDVLDIFRARVRRGPGIAAGVRATKVAQLYAGTYAAVYVGLPGARLRELPKSPVGLESFNGVDVSLMEATTGGGIGPDYSPTEIGFDLQLGSLGLAFGMDPVELADFGAGIFTFDPREDDI